MEKERKKFEDYVEMFGEHRFNREVSSKMNLAVDHQKPASKVKVEDREYTVSTDPTEWLAVER